MSGPVLGVSFKVDGVLVGNEVTTAPFGVSWDSATAVNGVHALTAVARSATSTTTSAPVSVTVANVAAPPPNEMFDNGSVESPSATPTVPASFSADSWGSLTASFTYPTGVAHTGARSVRVDVTRWSNGDAKWTPAAKPVTPGQTYRFTDWYRSNVSSQTLAVFTAPGGTSYQWLADPVAASTWTKYSTAFVAPPGATSVTVYHLIAAVGWLETDDYSLSVEVPHPFTRALISLTFDDAWASHATQALPLLQQYAMKGTFYITTGFLNTPDYMTTAQLLSLNAAGEDIGAHTIDHPHLPQLTAAQVDSQLRVPKATLETLLGRPVTSFATPYGEYNSAILTQINAVYASHRTVNSGYNGKVDTDVHQLKVQNVLGTTTRADIDAWIATAQANGIWLILTLHDITNTPSDNYDTSPANLALYLQAIQASGITVATMTDALAEITPQLS